MSDGCPFWEDFKVGDVFEFEGLPITKDEIFEFAREYDPQAIHLDEDLAKDSILGGLSASGWHNCARLMRLICNTYLCGSGHLGSPGVDEVRWKGPVRPGDRFLVKRTVKSARPVPGQTDRGMVQTYFEVNAQDGRPLMTMDCFALYKRRNQSQGVN